MWGAHQAAPSVRFLCGSPTSSALWMVPHPWPAIERVQIAFNGRASGWFPYRANCLP